MKIPEVLGKTANRLFGALATVFLTNEGFCLLLIAAAVLGYSGWVLGFLVKWRWWIYGLVWGGVFWRWSQQRHKKLRR